MNWLQIIDIEINFANIMEICFTLQPIFVEQANDDIKAYLTRSYSCPSLRVFDIKSPAQRRKRACSEIFYDGRELPQRREDLTMNQWEARMASRHSETNLLRIDREKTFQQQSVSADSENILAQVVIALSSLNNGLSELSPQTDIGKLKTSDERHTSPQLPNLKRSRAKSLYPNQRTHVRTDSNPTQMTWSGDDDAIQNYLNAQIKQGNEDEKTNTIEPSSRRRSIFNVFNNVFKRRNTLFNSFSDIEAVTEHTINCSDSDAKNNLPNPLGKPYSTVNMLKHKITNKEPNRRRSILSNASDQILDNATMTSLMHSIESAHARNLFRQRTSWNASTRDLINMNGKQHKTLFTRNKIVQYTPSMFL